MTKREKKRGGEREEKKYLVRQEWMSEVNQIELNEIEKSPAVRHPQIERIQHTHPIWVLCAAFARHNDTAIQFAV